MPHFLGRPSLALSAVALSIACFSVSAQGLSGDESANSLIRDRTSTERLSTHAMDSVPTAQIIELDPEKPLLAAPALQSGEAENSMVYEDLWSRVRAGFKLPQLDSPLVDRYEAFYRDRSKTMFERGGRYLYYIVQEIEKRGMPTELALLPFVESGMNPVAMSPAKAAGLWQFIPSTGRDYSLSQNWWVDNRRDVVQSTNAALEYLQKINNMHGDWFLALASYNWGENAVARAVKKNQAAGLPGDYLSLNMPNETRHYVPKLMALRRLVEKSGNGQYLLPFMPNQPYFTILEKIKPIDLKLAAKFAGMTVDEFIKLNPAHNRPVISSSASDAIILPTDRVEIFSQAVAEHLMSGKVLATWQPISIRPGETLDLIAKRLKVPESEIRRVNSIPKTAKLLPGTRLLAPHLEVADESMVDKFVAPRIYESVGTGKIMHVVKRKQTLEAIADKYDVSASDIRTWNGIRGQAKVGRSILVRPAVNQTVLTVESGKREIIRSEIVPVKIPKMEAVKSDIVSKTAKVGRPSKGVKTGRPSGKVKERIKKS